MSADRPVRQEQALSDLPVRHAGGGQPLREAGAGRLSIASRIEAKATELTQAVAGEPLPAAGLPAAITTADILVAATAAPGPTVLGEDVRTARKQAGHRPLFVLDLGMPPDAEPVVGQLPGVALVDLAALGRHLAAAGTPDHVSQARAIVSAEVAAYLTRQQQAAAAPVVAALHAQIRQLADAELARLQDRLPGLDDKRQPNVCVGIPAVRDGDPPSHLGTAGGRGDGPAADVPVMRIWASRVRASADDAKGQARRAAALQQLGELMPVEVVGVGLGQWPGDAEPGEL